LSPSPFLKLFGFTGLAQKVTLEMRHEQGRSDIFIETSRGVGVIEAKVDATDPLNQARRYPARWAALLTHRVPPSERPRRARYVSWEQLAEILRQLSRSPSANVKILAADLLKYLRDHRMVLNRHSVEVYAREVNEPVTLALFLKARLYGCTYQAGSPIAEALYFAPHFGQQIARTFPGVAAGISYIARIEFVGRAKTWREFLELVHEKRGRVWARQHREQLQDLRRNWPWGTEQRNFLFLGNPHLAFNPPIPKERLQKGRGWLNKRFFSFEALFAAWINNGYRAHAT